MNIKKLFLLFIVSMPVYADLTDFKVATWNLQGASARAENKWNVNIRQLISGENAVDILAIQEAGSPPGTASDTGRIIASPGIPVRELTWNLSTNSRPQNVFIYFSAVDALGGRVNLALISNRRADDVFLLAPVRSGGRPVLGIRIGEDAFFTAHAISSRNNDAADLVDEVYTFFRDNRDPHLQATNWMILGDFNRSPSDLEMNLTVPVRRSTAIISPSVATQTSQNILDYAVAGNSVAFIRPPLQAGIVYGARRTQISSDHYPVGISKRQER
ncbi:cytolethal distending toxin subunit B family protein [Salmonella enterica subsp. enterica]|nr:cytolethal distending toxin subunit B family protein [Salmonella enterica subsp. enterica]ECH9152523.1 cytolethal distending toxin subunit B family protein [Salmonella enterica subsp. enterica]EDR9396377.1 cytolethal distending toxin subunit B family protein [Salmonella enterica subsp. enterica]EGI5886248.1 cytolethal distending toxin subunit B family protein [Salmonella enterica subsp. enterica serovar Magwa]MIY23228.1 cytolethal distending toxin subunit B family protein [Salmonella enteric